MLASDRKSLNVQILTCAVCVSVNMLHIKWSMKLSCCSLAFESSTTHAVHAVTPGCVCNNLLEQSQHLHAEGLVNCVLVVAERGFVQYRPCYAEQAWPPRRGDGPGTCPPCLDHHLTDPPAPVKQALIHLRPADCDSCFIACLSIKIPWHDSGARSAVEGLISQMLHAVTAAEAMLTMMQNTCMEI